MGDKVAHERAVFTHTHGILFFGTPHLGSPKATWIKHASMVLSILKPLRLPTFETKLTAALEPDSEVLQNMSDDFLPLMSGLHIAFFWEEKTTKFGVFREDFVVSRDSAAPLYDDTQRSGIASTHSGMVKFDDAQSAGFIMVMSILEAYGKEAQGEVQKKVALDRSMRQLRLDHEIMSLTSAMGVEERLEKEPRNLESSTAAY
jgi:protein SERAC1